MYIWLAIAGVALLCSLICGEENQQRLIITVNNYFMERKL